MRGFLMARAYFVAAFSARIYACKRRIVVIITMSSKIALSDIKNYLSPMPETPRKSPPQPPERPDPDAEASGLDPGHTTIAPPSDVAPSGTLDRLAETALNYARAAVSENTRRAYAKDWAHFARWRRMRGTDPFPHDLRCLRDRAILLIGFAGSLRCSEIVSLDHGRDDTPDSGGWVQVLDDGALITLRSKTGWREVEIARGSSEQTCPVHALTQWLQYGRIDFGPLFVAVGRNGMKVTPDRLSDKHVARLIKQTVEEAGLRAGLASSAEVDERYVQKQLGHASAEMTRRYQRRRDRFSVNLTKTAGLQAPCPSGGPLLKCQAPAWPFRAHLTASIEIGK